MNHGWLLIAHIASGVSALVAAVAAFVFKTANSAHKWHVYSGRWFFWSILVVAVTAVPLAIGGRNLFLLLIGLFTFYLAWSGLRFARRDRGTPPGIDRAGAALMAAVGVVMVSYGLVMFARGDGLGIALVVFGGLGLSLCAGDLRGRAVDLQSRIAGHLTRMLAATIATVTAFLVTNVTFEPAVVIWLAPTAIITPVIVWWNRRIHSGFRPKGMPDESGEYKD